MAFLDLVEHHQGQPRLAALVRKRPHGDREENPMAVVRVQRDAGVDAAMVALGFEKRGAQFEPDVGAYVGQQVVARLAATALQKAPCAWRQVQHSMGFVDEHARWRELFDRLLVQRGVARPLGAAARRAGDQRTGKMAQRARQAVADRRHRARRRAGRVEPVDAVLLVERDEGIAGRVGRLRAAEEQQAAGIERDPEHLQHMALRRAIEVDQQIPAADHIEPRERRVVQQVVHREQHRLARRTGHAKLVCVAVEEAAQPLGRHVLRDAFGIQAPARDGDRLLVDVGREYLQLE